MAAGADEDLVLVGTVARPHGLRGEVAINPETDFPDERFAPGSTLLVKRGAALETLTVASMRYHQGRPMVTFAGITSLTEAERLGRPQLWVRAADRVALPDGRFYHDELIGCRVETVGGEAVGVVTRIEETGGVPLLVIGPAPAPSGASPSPAPAGDTAGAEEDEVFVPLADTICREIDPVARRIVIDPPDGLLDVNRR